jgi:glycosyltransferase involved in cell wall biosynthesis
MSTPSPRITVIIATYNWSTVLPFSIGSVLNQSFTDFELLVIGDGCTDNSAEVVAAIDDPRLRWINLEKNSGHQSGPHNRGLEEARAEFIAYLGHDDLWLPHHLACMVAALELTNADLAYSIVGAVRPGAVTAVPLLPAPAGGSWSPPSGMMHRREVTRAIGGWADYRRLQLAPDPELWARARAAGFMFEFVPRLTALKFSAAVRKNVYRERPCHEQADWFSRCADPNFESAQLMAMILGGEALLATPGRTLFPLAAKEFIRRGFGRLAFAWETRSCGTQITKSKRFKGL